MNPLLYPLALIIYGEGSYCRLTRNVCRCLIYSYSLTVIGTCYTDNYIESVIISFLSSSSAFIYCIVQCEKLSGKTLFSIILIGTVCIHTALAFKNVDFDIGVNGYYLLRYSNYFHREGVLLAIGMCSHLVDTDPRVRERDIKLSLIVTTMWILEKIF